MQPNSATNFVDSSNSPTTHQSPNFSQSALWRGRKCHKSKNSLSIGLQAAISAILTLVGILFFLFSFNPFMGGLFGGSFTGLGVLLGHEAYKEFRSPNHLEEALKYLTNQTNLDNLPGLSEKEWKNKEDRRSIIPSFGSASMDQPVLALKENGKTIAVAIKYLTLSSFFPARITIFSFKERLECQLNGLLHVQNSLDASEGRFFESLLLSN